LIQHRFTKISNKQGFVGIEIKDEFGVDQAIKLSDTSLILYTLTMITKRIENDEAVNVFELFDKIKLRLRNLKTKWIKNEFCA